MKLYIYILLFIVGTLSIQTSIAQHQTYIKVKIGVGLVDSKINNLTQPADPLIDQLDPYYNFAGAVGVERTWQRRYSAELGISQTMRFWNLSGTKNGNSVKVSNLQNFTSVYIGGYYQLPITKDQKLNVEVGTRLSIDFVDYSKMNKKDGITTNYVLSYTDKIKKIIFNASPEIGCKRYLSGGNFWKVAVAYHYPINETFLDGMIEHHLNNTKVEEIKYISKGRFFELSFIYGFLL